MPKHKSWPKCCCLDCAKAEIERLSRRVNSLKNNVRGILDLGTRMVDKFESPIGVNIEGYEVRSFRLERAWCAAIASLEG